MKKKKIINILFAICVTLFLACCAYLIFYLGIQPYYFNQQDNEIRTLYYNNSGKSTSDTISKFSELLDINKDTKGWLTIPNTNIDYPVVQGEKDSDFYLHHNFKKAENKNGCLYIDANCNVETPSKNIVIHGHNMESTRLMFYELPQYKDIQFYREHPIIVFDSIYEEAKWKIISFMRVSGDSDANDGFNYMQGDFNSDKDFLNFIYQIEMRSLYSCPVKVNENDTILMLSTCTYEIDNCRSVVVARKIRKGESEDVNTQDAYLRDNVLYPSIWYSKYGGSAPQISSFQTAFRANQTDWYDGNIQKEQ